jgi:hypothetical protein
MRILIENGRGQITILDVPNYITVRDLNERYNRRIGDDYRFEYIYNGSLLEYDEHLNNCGIENDDIIVVNGRFAAGGGGEHTCPYGCGRKIPDNYKGCTELLKDFPNYFDNK